jgi:hypothetical protein
MSASLNCVAWKSARLWPNARRCCAYVTDASSAAARDAERLRGDADAAAVERLHGELEAVVLAAEERLVRDEHVGERELRGVGRMQAPSSPRLRSTSQPGVVVSTRNAPIPLLPFGLVDAREHECEPGVRARS